MRIDIYSDVVCPWCFIGKRRFERAVSQFEPGTFQVRWRPFQLDPDAPGTPSPTIDVYAKKFGGYEKAEQIFARVTEVANTEGLTFRLDQAQRANTFYAHLLLDFAADLDADGLESRLPADAPIRTVQADVKERLMTAYFTEGENVASRRVLIDIATSAGMDVEATNAYLDNEVAHTQLRVELEDAHRRDINSVPTFVLAGEFAVPGAQETEWFVSALSRLLKQASDR